MSSHSKRAGNAAVKEASVSPKSLSRRTFPTRGAEGLTVARVFVDTNVLLPFVLMDTMLTLAEDGVHEFLWSEALLAEWERVIVREQARSPAAAAKLASIIREYFAEGYISEARYVDRSEERR